MVAGALGGEGDSRRGEGSLTPRLCNVLVVQTWGVGDMIMTTPMLLALRRRRPDARITLLAYDRVAAEPMHGLVDDIRVVAPFTPTIAGAARAIAYCRTLRRDRFDAAIVATTIASRFAPLLRFVAGVPVVVGDTLTGRGFGYTHVRRRTERHRVAANVDLLRSLVSDAEISGLYFHVDADSARLADETWARLGLTNRQVLGIHPGSNPRLGHDKRPQPETLRRIMRSLLAANTDARIALLIGPHEQDVSTQLAVDDPRVVTIEQMPLPAVASIVARMRALLAGDSGLGHVAAAMNVPTITLAGPTAVSTTHPWSDRNVIVRTRETLSCMPCYGTPLYGRCPYGTRCMRTIDDDDILAALLPHFASVNAPVTACG